MSASPGSDPWIASSSSALSRTVRASAPNTLSPSHPSRAGCVETRPRLGFIPTSAQHAAGIRSDPPPSEPVAHGTIPDATAAADPPEEPPGVRVVSQGLRVTPFAAVAVHGKIISSGTLVIPIGIAPARAQPPDDLAVGRLRGPNERDPRVIDWPATGMSSLIAIGTPASSLSSPPDTAPPPTESGHGVGRGERLVGHRHAERVQLRVDRLDPRQEQLDELTRFQIAAAHHVRERARPGEGQVLLGCRRHAWSAVTSSRIAPGYR